jgi:glycosyltransferase involved in cell wall biosynthesis
MVYRKELVYHCSPYLPSETDGGMMTYIHALLKYRIPNVSEQVLKSIKGIDQKEFYLLHVHGNSLLQDLQGTCPVVYTLHNHSSYCPSGTKYLARNGRCCDRKMSYLGCAYGHLMDGCGSRRPQTMLHNLQGSFRELEILKKLKIVVAANSDYVRMQLIENGFPSERVVTLRLSIQSPAIPTEPLTSEIHQKQRILFVGRITPEKGLDLLLRSLQLTSANIRLDIAGEGWAKAQIEKLSRKLGLEDRVTWHGWCSKEKLEILYRQCFAVVFPSIWPEPAGLITLEAYAHYRPIIASSVGGIPEYIRDGKTGILVEPNDSEAFASAIACLGSDFNGSRSMGKMGHDWLHEEFSMDIHVKQLQKVYEKAVAMFQSKL